MHASLLSEFCYLPRIDCMSVVINAFVLRICDYYDIDKVNRRQAPAMSVCLLLYMMELYEFRGRLMLRQRCR